MDVVLNNPGTCGACKHWGKNGTDWCSKMRAVQFCYVDATECKHYKDAGRKAITTSMSGLVHAEFDSPEAKDEFIRSLVSTAQTNGNVRDYLLGGANPNKVN